MADALNEAAITEALQTLDGWEREGDSLARTFEFDAYLAGVAFASAVGTLCEARNHHPDLMEVGYKKVILEFTTHDAGGKITQNDVDVAHAINALMGES
jgi:4a-hydroxytetrahydrobiopterin dehydratase